MDLILIRHPRTVAPPGTCYGATDVAADPECLAEAASRLASLIPADARLIASPQRRALDLARRFGEPTIEPRLVELDFGAWENRLWSDLPREEIDGWAADFLDYAAPGGESVRQMAGRVLGWWDEARETGGSIVVVTHGGPCRVLAAHLTGAPLENANRFEIGWGRYARFRIAQGIPQLRAWNLADPITRSA